MSRDSINDKLFPPDHNYIDKRTENFKKRKEELEEAFKNFYNAYQWHPDSEKDREAFKQLIEEEKDELASYFKEDLKSDFNYDILNDYIEKFNKIA